MRSGFLGGKCKLARLFLSPDGNRNPNFNRLPVTKKRSSKIHCQHVKFIRP
jgi:hypothetical protein